MAVGSTRGECFVGFLLLLASKFRGRKGTLDVLKAPSLLWLLC